jgi:hypothetical protein
MQTREGDSERAPGDTERDGEETIRSMIVWAMQHPVQPQEVSDEVYAITLEDRPLS